MRVLTRFICVLFVALPFVVKSQDIEQVIKAKPVTISGGVNVDQTYSPSNVSGGDPDQPYIYVLSADATPVLWGVLNLPFSISYSNRTFNRNYPFNQQPFNSFGISPNYRWIKVHAGWRTMNFSQYSLSSHRFLGGGIELTPEHFQAKAMYGRLLKAVKPDSTMKRGNTPCYERWGEGVAFNYVNGSDKYGFSLFRGFDKGSSLDKPLDSLGKYPEQNFVYTLNLTKTIASKLTVNLEFAQSILTEDSRIQTSEPTFFQDNVYVYKNKSTSTRNAYKGDLSYQFSFAQVGVGYERVDPGYTSHGAYYYNNDFENITANVATALFKKRVMINASGGYEHDNLDKKKETNGKRIVGQLGVNWAVNQKLQIGGNYSNFRSIMEYLPTNNLIQTIDPYALVDSLKYVQVSQNVMLMSSYNVKRQKVSHTISGSVGVMTTSDIVGGELQDTKATYYNSSANYTLGLLQSKVTISPGLNYYHSVSSLQDGGALGPSVNVGKTYLKDKAKSSVGYSYTIPMGMKITKTHGLNTSHSLSIGKHQSLTLTAMWLIPAESGGTMKNYSVQLHYGYRF